MTSIRQEKVGELVKQELSIIFQRNTSIRFDGIFITVTIVRMSPDLGLAKVFLSFLVVKEPEEALNKIKRESNWIRKTLAGVIGKQVRRIPELHFHLDDSLDYYESVEEALKS